MEKSKKELKEEYKQKKFRIGVFQIRNTVNNKIFIDSSMDLDKIYNRHRMQLDHGSHPNTVLQKDWKSLGEEKFVFEILGEVKTSDDDSVDYKREAQLLKQLYIDELMPFDEKGYHSKSVR